MQKRHRLRINQQPRTILGSMIWSRSPRPMSKQYPTTKAVPFQNLSYRKRNNQHPRSIFRTRLRNRSPVGNNQHPNIKTLTFDTRYAKHMNIIKTKTKTENRLITRDAI